MKLAERAGSPWLLLMAIGAGASLFVMPDRTPEAEPEPVLVTTPTAVAESPCPAFVREHLRLDDARVACVRATFGEPAWFAIGDYTTTEPWQRLMVISDDGTRILVHRTDRPTYRPTGELSARDLDGDGSDEVINGRERISVVDGQFVFDLRPVSRCK